MTDESAHVLVVDDRELNLRLPQRVIQLGGHEVIAVSSLASAEDALAAQLPARIVLDLQLPDGDGLDLARRLKAKPETASCVVLPCTAEAMHGDAERALAAGSDASVSKPIDTREFSALADDLLHHVEPYTAVLRVVSRRRPRGPGAASCACPGSSGPAGSP